MDQQNLVIDVGPAQIQDAPFVSSPAQTAENVVGAVPLSFLTPEPTISSPFMDPWRDAANSSTMPALTWWTLTGTFLGVFVSAWLMKRGLPEFGTIVVGGLLFVGIALVSGTEGMIVVAILWILWAVGSVTIRHSFMRG